MYQGQLAVGKIPPPIPLDDILSKNPKPLLLVAVDALTSAENLGALVRNCVAFGVQALIVGETSSSPFLRRAVRNSMGTILQLPVVELAKLGQRHQFTTKPHATAQTLVECLKELHTRGVRCLAAHPHTNNHFLSQADFSGDCCIVFGSEGNGISAPVLEVCDEAVVIPMPPTVDSLNVGAAAAVFLYEVNRQRGKMA
jgi:tRNA G18 (ribose-2'-O)-methylase SpoU